MRQFQEKYGAALNNPSTRKIHMDSSSAVFSVITGSSAVADEGIEEIGNAY
jgi:hypothetical protein